MGSAPSAYPLRYIAGDRPWRAFEIDGRKAGLRHDSADQGLDFGDRSDGQHITASSQTAGEARPASMSPQASQRAAGAVPERPPQRRSPLRSARRFPSSGQFHQISIRHRHRSGCRLRLPGCGGPALRSLDRAIDRDGARVAQPRAPSFVPILICTADGGRLVRDLLALEQTGRQVDEVLLPHVPAVRSRGDPVELVVDA